jgi:uncharacterized protein YcfL
MVNVYKALNFAAMGDHENARVEFNRALQRQVRAKERFAAEIARNRREVAAEESSQNAGTGSAEQTMDSPQTQQILSREYSNLDQFQAYPDFVNPFATYPAGRYFLLRGDHNKALDILKEAHGMLPDNPIVAEDFAAADANRRVLGKVYVLFENGMVPSKQEIRVDLPLFIFTNHVRYTGIALPKLAPRQRAYPYIDVVSNGATTRTVPLASMDAVVAAEFRKDLPMVVGRAVASAIAKAALQYMAQKELGDLAGILAAGYSAISTAVDQRIWSALPKEFQVGVTTMPTDRQLVLQCPGAGTVNIPMPSCVNAIVCVRIPRAGALPVVQIIALNSEVAPMRFHHVLLPVLLVTLALVAGCQSPVAYSEPELDIDPALKKDVVTSGFLVTRNQGDLMQVQVTLKNLGYGTLPLRVKTDWFDLNGMLQESLTSSWKTVSIARQAELPMKFTAPNEQAARFRIYVREAKRN